MRAHEDSNCFSRQCCERLRSFEMTIKDRKSENIIRIVRPQRCDNCLCFPCFNQVILLLNLGYNPPKIVQVIATNGQSGYSYGSVKPDNFMSSPWQYLE